jgi:rsbT co-antagonist protein RsbR
MAEINQTALSESLRAHQATVQQEWMQEQKVATTLRADLLSEKELQQQSTEFLTLFLHAIAAGTRDINASEFSAIRQFLANLSTTRANQGFTSSETCTFVFSLKQPLFNCLSKVLEGNELMQAIWYTTVLLDKLGLYTTEQYQKSREDIITRQQQDMLELSTPVAKLWEGILVLPLIGTLDSARTQQVMENLLQKIVETSSSVAIIDITGIPTVDTLVAQHLIKTMSAARLMGADCIVSGIRPQIAQTMVHLGISLQEVVTKATLADAVSFAMRQAGFTITRAAKL